MKKLLLTPLVLCVTMVISIACIGEFNNSVAQAELEYASALKGCRALGSTFWEFDREYCHQLASLEYGAALDDAVAAYNDCSE